MVSYLYYHITFADITQQIYISQFARYILPFTSIVIVLILLVLPFAIKMKQVSNIQHIDINHIPLQTPRNMLAQPPESDHLKACNIVIAHGGDKGAGCATQIFLYGINFFLYSQINNMTLWINYKNNYNSICSDPLMNDENIWNYYLEPVTPLSQNCNINISNITVLKKKYIFPRMHLHLDYTIKAWYYGFYYSKRKKWHKQSIDYETYLESWYYSQRKKGFDIVSKYFHYQSDLINEKNKIWQRLFGNDYDQYEILGVHMRGTDKAALRRKVLPSEYLEYIQKFVNYYGNDKAKVFIATDDDNYLNYITSDLQSQNITIYAQNNIYRSKNETAVFDLQKISKYQMVKELLMDILMLSQCDWFIHSASAVAEAVFYNNIHLHNKSVHLEYLKNRQTPTWYQ